ncbi:MAG: MiaB/RimO family radical SAM methylthiotransferase [bacterium]|nr:MiaB/RimO family radical SAM methylthiotransferase [bacterium]
MKLKYLIKTFGCQQNHADSERIESVLKSRNMIPAKNFNDADYIVINTCMVRESAENRAFGLINNLAPLKIKNPHLKIILTGCMVGLAHRDSSGKYFKKLRDTLPAVDEFMPIEEVGFDNQPVRKNSTLGLIPISNGCNNFCTYCVVPFTRGREISRPYKDIMKEAKELKEKGFKEIMLLGQNVNSYGSDLVNSKSKLKPVYVKHLGRHRIPTLFPHLLRDVAQMGFEKVSFISSNPWDFSDELIDVIAQNKNITRTIHLPVQSGDTNVLKRMNRWYTRDEYLNLIAKLKLKIKNLKLTTDIIVGFCEETEIEFQNTVDLCKKVGFEIAYISEYSSRYNTAATKVMKDNVPHTIKEKRWQILENLINKPHLKKRTK